MGQWDGGGPVLVIATINDDAMARSIGDSGMAPTIGGAIGDYGMARGKQRFGAELFRFNPKIANRGQGR